MDLKTETREFLSTRRARITPERAGLPAYGGHRRVPGLRREEVSMLAGVSVDYYTRLERGNLGGVSEEVLEALAEALQLDEAERGHLFDLARAANALGCCALAGTPRTSPGLAPCRPADPRRDAGRPGLRAQRQARRPRLQRARACALRAAVRVGRADHRWARERRAVHVPRPDAGPGVLGEKADRIAHDSVAIIRAEAGRNPYDTSLTALVGELSTRSEDFRRLWASHDVRYHRSGTKVFCHPVVGRMELDFEALVLPADPGLQVNVYTAAPSTPSADALTLLASWAATGRPAAGATSSAAVVGRDEPVA